MQMRRILGFVFFEANTENVKTPRGLESRAGFFTLIYFTFFLRFI